MDGYGGLQHGTSKPFAGERSNVSFRSEGQFTRDLSRRLMYLLCQSKGLRVIVVLPHGLSFGEYMTGTATGTGTVFAGVQNVQND